MTERSGTSTGARKAAPPAMRARCGGWILAAASLAGLGGCGHAIAVGTDRTLHIAVGEYRLRPDAARLAAGQLTIVVQNLGRLSHDLVVADGNRWLGATKPIWPGQSATLTLDLPAGTYSMFSALLSDQSLGDYGTITVTP